MRTRGWQGDIPADSDEARERILAAASRCVTRFGLQKTRLADVAAEAGVTRQTVYRYFSSVNEMLAAVAADGVGDFLDRMGTALAHVHTAEDAIVETIVYCLEVLPDEPALGLMLRVGETEFFTSEATSSGAIALGAEMLRRLPVDWAEQGYDQDAMTGLAELVMRIWLSFQMYPNHPPRSAAQMRAFIRRTVVPGTRSHQP